MKKLVLIGLFFFSQSCAVYQQDYDCPAEKGVGCKSLTQIEKMIKVNKEGPNDFIPLQKDHLPTSKACCKTYPKRKSQIFATSPIVKRVWVDTHTTEEGHKVQGHFVYFVLNDGQWEFGG